MKNVIISFTIKADQDLDAVKVAIVKYVEKVHELDSNVIYTSFQSSDDELRFINVGLFPSQEAFDNVRAQPFYSEFTEFLIPGCEEAPEVTPVTLVGSTHS
jgi:quinol monooxygenase YgiN